ncbi:porin [Vibrio sp. S11_S32]|uniref:porin n=1 Tax=Vibrio sp. S11_S32 TaxID=2720225 RepID=UPI00168012E0|nr:porin [Vibrio sp. S11_S32]MBD1575884.1 porin [Vibrio sp. S11_S32]
MEKIFKRTLLGAAVSLAAVSGAANAVEVGLNSDFKVEVYGVAAISVVNYNVGDNRDASSGAVIENESRIGFRADKDIIDDLNVFMQIESGYVDNTDWGQGGNPGGVLGFRDTFVGLQGDSWGKVRFGRMLTPMYEIIDWPFSNPGLGSVFDWGGVQATYDRQSNQVRYDSLNYGGFSFAASVGRDTGGSAFGGGNATRDSYFGGLNAKYTISKITFMGALETGTDFKGVKGDDNFAYIAGVDIALPAGFGLAAAYKHEEINADMKAGDKSQDSYSIIGQYWYDNIGFKLGYAANLDSEQGGIDMDDDMSTISGQLMMTVNGFVPYVRVAGRKAHRTDSAKVATNDTDIVTRVGIEYGF